MENKDDYLFDVLNEMNVAPIDDAGIADKNKREAPQKPKKQAGGEPTEQGKNDANQSGGKEKAEVVAKPKKAKPEKGYKNTYIYGFIFILFSVIFEIANFARFGLGVLPSSFGIEFAIIIIIAGIIFIVPSEAAKISICSIFLGVQMVMNVANASLYKMMYDIISVDMIFTLGFETMDAFRLNQLDLLALGINLFITALYVLSIVFGTKYAPRYKIQKNRSAILSLIMLLSLNEVLGFGLLKISQNSYFAKTDSEYIMDDGNYVYGSQAIKLASLKKYGFWCFYLNNAGNFFGYKKTASKDEYAKLKEYVEAGAGYTITGSTFGGSDVSGILSGDNLIVAMMESGEWFAMDPYNTPSLYNFVKNEAIEFNNFYGRNKTNISENISILGSITNDYSFSTINDNVGISAPNSLPNLFKDAGYESVDFFHDYTGKMYDRDTNNVAFGFDNVYALEQYDGEDKSKFFGDFLDDGDWVWHFRNQMMPRDKKFFSYFTTVTSHGGYEGCSNPRYQAYYDKFEENYDDFCAYVEENNLNFYTPERGSRYYEILKEYKSRAMALDHMINVMSTYLKTTIDTNGELMWDNTTIVIFADHNAYYDDLNYTIKGTDKYGPDKENYRIPFALYNKKLGSATVDTFCSTYDIYPTICDLYGFTFNKNLVQGHSVFSEDIEKSVFVSSMCGIFNDFYYTATLDKYYAVDDSLATNSKLVNFKQGVSEFLSKQQYIEKYYRINYENYKAE